ncbi:EamA family transporter [Agromyces indicus]|uniref:DMT family transporter n=1 Tax=Agromyces indicus TaxID=758919 RepID=A0ABU1FK10_9MICO|nr:DMT family transporter [Agromyces indicus]MDR5692073.1 DMT family transporter [Agromyces indicus]
MGYVYALSAALLFGLNGSVTRVTVDAGIDPAQLTFIRVLSVCLIAGGWLALTDRGAFRITRRQVAVMAVLGVAGVALLQWTYAMAIKLLPVGIALLLEYLAVLAVAVIARVFFGERVKGRLWVAIALVLAGLALVARPGGADLDPVGVLFGLAAAATLTVYFLVGERQVAATSPMAVAFWSMGFATLFWAMFSGWWRLDPALLAATTSLDGALEAVSVPLWLVVAWNAVLGSFAPFLLSFLALRRLSATAVGIVASSEVVFAFAFAWMWLGQALDPFQLAGASVVLVAIILAQTARPDAAMDADLASQRLAASMPDDESETGAAAHAAGARGAGSPSDAR